MKHGFINLKSLIKKCAVNDLNREFAEQKGLALEQGQISIKHY